MSSKVVGIIGGSGLYEIEGLTDVEEIKVETPFGDPSDAIIKGRLGDTEMLFLPRHGRGHKISPSDINYRANIYALKKLGAEWIISVSAVGSMREEIEPGHMVVVDQFIDRTRAGRKSTFFGEGIVGHVSFADPVCGCLSEVVAGAAERVGATVHKGGTYVCMEGPQFSTRAESLLYRSWGASVIGMTNVPESKLAREAEICYATLALSTDYDCWHEEEESVTVEMILETIKNNVATAKAIIAEAAPAIAAERSCACKGAMAFSIVTDKSTIPAETKENVKLLWGEYL